MSDLVPMLALSIIISGGLIWLWRRPKPQWMRSINATIVAQLWPTVYGSPRYWVLPFVTLALGAIWLADPLPAQSNKQPIIWLVDQSMSMWATDLPPNRQTAMRYKLKTLAARVPQRPQGVVAWAGDAYTVMPITDDASALQPLFDALDPNLMPLAGSRPDRAVDEAVRLLIAAGYAQATLVLVTDGIEPLQAKQLQTMVENSEQGIELLLYSVATEMGAPITLPDGRNYVDEHGQLVIPFADHQAFGLLAEKNHWIRFTVGDHDINTLVDLLKVTKADKQANPIHYGYLALFPLLLLWLFYWRRGDLLLAMLMLIPLLQPHQAQAAWWQDNEQLAQQAIEDGDYQSAASLSQNALRRGNALYYQGRYDEALSEYRQVDGASSLYNQGNTFAQLGQLEQAISLYQQALLQEPQHMRAQANLALVEEQLKAQQQQQQQQPSPQQNDQQAQEDGRKEQPSPAELQGESQMLQSGEAPVPELLQALMQREAARRPRREQELQKW